jgi:hypothetical protein
MSITNVKRASYIISSQNGIYKGNPVECLWICIRLSRAVGGLPLTERIPETQLRDQKAWSENVAWWTDKREKKQDSQHSRSKHMARTQNPKMGRAEDTQETEVSVAASRKQIHFCEQIRF